MDPANYGLVEMALSFGVMMLFCSWQLVSLERTKKKLAEKAAAAESEKGT